MAEYDGDIKLHVDLDTKSTETALKSLRGTITSSLSEASVTGIDRSLLGMNKTVRETQKEFQKVQNEITKTDNKLRELQTKQSVVLERGLKSPTKTATYEYDNRFFNKADYASIRTLDTQLENTGAHLDDLVDKSKTLSITLASTEINPNISSGMEEATQQTQNTNTGLEAVNQRLKELQTTGNQSANVLTTGLSNVNRSVGKLEKRLIGMAKRVFFFSLITKALRSLRSMLATVAKSDIEFSNSLKQIQSNLWTAFAAIYTKVLPALNALMSALARVTSYITAFITALTGNSIKNAYNTANELYKQVNQEDLRKQQKSQLDNEIKAIQNKIKALQKENKTIEENEKVQEKANKKTLLSFDELNQISAPDVENEQIAANEKLIEQYEEQLEALQDEKLALEEAADAANALAENLAYPTFADTISSEITKIVQNLMLVIEGSLLVIGVILLFTGNIGLGLAVIVGALVAMNYTLQSFEFSDPGIANIVAKLWAALIAAELVIGAILVFSGANVPLGIGIIIAALAQSYALYQVSWDSVTQEVKNAITALAVASATVMIALGLVMIFSGAAIVTGIALVVAGLAIGISGVALNWEEVTTNIQTQLQLVEALVGGALVAVGVILIFTGVAIIAGIAMIVAGLALTADAVVDWNAIPDNIKTIISTIAAVVSTAMIVIGIIVLLTGNIMAGIALILSALTISETIVNWELVPEKVKNVIDTLLAKVSVAMLAIGVVLLFTGNIVLGAALILLEVAVVETIIDWNMIPDEVKKVISALTAIIGLATLEIGFVLLFLGQIPLGLGLIVVGAASLFTSIQAAPEALRTQIQNEISFYMMLIGGALLVVGAILCFTGVMIPEGIAMMGAGALSLLGGIAVKNIDTNAMGNIVEKSLSNTNQKVTTGLKDTQDIFDKSMDTIDKTVKDGFKNVSETASETSADISDAVSENMENTGDAVKNAMESMDDSMADQTGSIIDSMDKISDRLSELDGSKATITIEEIRTTATNGSQGSPWSPSMTALPHLAQGSVIPPNREFMAVLGDQKSGTNIEAPLDTIKQAVAEVLGQGEFGGNNNVNVTITGDMAKFLRVAKKESVRAGSSIIIGGNRV